MHDLLYFEMYVAILFINFSCIYYGLHADVVLERMCAAYDVLEEQMSLVQSLQLGLTEAMLFDHIISAWPHDKLSGKLRELPNIMRNFDAVKALFSDEELGDYTQVGASPSQSMLVCYSLIILYIRYLTLVLN